MPQIRASDSKDKDPISILVILGKDKIGQIGAKAIGPVKGVRMVWDCSSNLKRVARLVIKRRIKLALLLKMFWAEVLRESSGDSSFSTSFVNVKDNSELRNLMIELKPAVVVCFRAGLIIAPRVLSLGIPFYNIHAAKVPEFGGLGSIQKALTAGAYHQSACLHQIEHTIDTGPVLLEEPYQLDPQATYSENEDRAYSAGIALLVKSIDLLLNKF